MNYYIKAMEKEKAKAIFKWKYDGIYNIYNIKGNEEELEEFINGEYYLIENEKNEIIGYFCFGFSAQVPGLKKYGVYDEERVIDIGLGMRPDLTGCGYGFEFLKVGIEFAIEKFKINNMRLTVAAFNKRAIKAYEKAGFGKNGTYSNITPSGSRDFIIMKR